MDKNITTINQDSKLALNKAKSLLNITNKLLAKKQENLAIQEFNYRLHIDTGHSGIVDPIAITPDGKYIISGGSDKIIKLLDIGLTLHKGTKVDTNLKYSLNCIRRNPSIQGSNRYT